MRRLAAFTLFVAACGFDRSDRWITDPVKPAPTPACKAGATRCTAALERCNDAGDGWTVVDDCAKKNLICSSKLGKCASCEPGASRCDGQTVKVCNSDGSAETTTTTCDTSKGIAC